MLSFSISALSCDNIPLLEGRKIDGSTAELYIKTSKLQETESWDPKDPNPPLSIEEVLSIFDSWKEGKPLKISSIDLNRHGCYKTENKWFYVINYSTIKGGKEVFEIGNWFAVLFDKSYHLPVHKPSQ